MHVVMLVAIGLLVLGAFVFGARLLLGGRGTEGAWIFIWVWLASALVNGAVGILYAKIPLINEIGAFVAIFGIPAAAAWYLARRNGASAV